MEAFEPLEVIPPSPEENVDASNASDATVRAAQAMAGVVEGSDTVSARRRAFLTGSAHLTATAGNYVEDYALLWEKAPFAAANARTRNFARAVVTPRRAGYASVTHDPAALKRQIDYSKEDSAATAAMTQRETVSKRQMAAAASFKAAVQWSRAPKRHAAAVHTARKAHWSVAARNGAVTETAAAATAMFGYARYDALSMLAAAAHPASTATPAVDLNRTVVCSALHFSLRAAQTAVATRRRQALLRQAAAASRVSDATVIKTGLAANRKLKAFRATVEQRALPPVVTAASAYHSIGTALRDLVAHRCPAVAGREARVLRSSAAYFNVSAVGGSCRAFHDLAESIDAGLIEVPSTSTRRTLMETTASPAAAPWWFRLFSESVATDARPPSRHQGAGTTSSNSAKETAADQKAASNSTTPKRKKATAAAGESLREAKLYGRRRRSVPSVFDTGLLQAGVPVTTEQHAAMLHQLGRDCGDFRATAAQARAAIAHVVVRSAKGRRTSTAPEPPSPLLDAEHETRALRTAEDLLARRNAVLRDPTATTTSSTARGEAAEENTRMSSDVSSEPTANTIPTRVQLRWRPSKARALTSPLEPKGDGSTAAHPAVLTTTACETALRETDVFAKTVASEQALLRMWHDRAFFRQSCAPASPHLAAPAIWWKVLDTDGSSIVADAGDGMLAYSSRRRGKSVQGPVKHRESLAANIDEDTVFGRRAKKFPATPRGAASPFDAHSAKRVTAGSIGPDNAYALAVLEALEHWRGVGDWRLLDDALSMLDGGRQFAGHHEDADGSVPAAAQSPAGNGETKTAKAEEEPFWSTAAAAVGAAVKQTMSWVSAIFGELPPCDFSTEPTETSLWHVQLTLREESKSDQTVTDDGAVASAPPRDNSAAALALWRTLSTIRTNDARNVIDARHTSAHLSGVMEATVLGRGATSERDPWPRRAASIALELRLGDDARHTAAAHIAATDALANETYVKEMLRRADAHYFRCALVPPPLLRSQECAHRLLGSLGGARRAGLADYLKTLYDVGHASGHHVRRFVPFMPMLRSATTALQESWARAESTISHAPNPRRNSQYSERPPVSTVDDEVAAFHRVVTAALSPAPPAQGQGSSGGEQDTDPVDAAVDVIVRYALETHAKAVAVEARQRVRSVAAKHMALLAKGDSSLLAAEDVPRAPGAVGRRLKTFMARKPSDDDGAKRKKSNKKGSGIGTDSTDAKGERTKLSSSGGYEEEEPQPGSHKYHAEGLEAATSVIGLQSVQGLADVSALTAGSLTTKDVDAAAAKLIAWYFASTDPHGGRRAAKGANVRDNKQQVPIAQAVDVDTAAEAKCPLCAALGIAALRMSRRIAEAFPGLHAASKTLRGRRSVRFGDDFLAPRLPLDVAVPRLLSSTPRGSGRLPPHLLALKQEDESRSLPILSFSALSPTRLATAILSNATAVLEAVAGATKIVDAVTDEDCAPRKAAHGARSGESREEKETERTAEHRVGGHRPTSHCAFPVVAYSVSDGLVEVRRPPLSTLRPTADRGVPTDAPGSSEELFE